MMRQRNYTIQSGQKYLRFLFMATVLLSLLFASAELTNGASSPTSVLLHTDTPRAASSDVSSYPSDVERFIQRGDWETPDILLLVENEEWHDSIDVIVTASLHDRIPAYILSNGYDDGEGTFMKQPGKPVRGQTLRFSYDTPWIRDYGPLQLKTSGNMIQWMDFGYAEDRPRDDSVPQQLASYMELPIEYGDYYLEGGAIISNGRGLCAITDVSVEKALVDQSSPDEVASFRKILGCSALAILPALSGESTGHADIMAQFLAPFTVAVSSVDPDLSSKLSLELDQAVVSIVTAARSIGQKLNVIRVPMYVDGPDFYSYVNGTRLRNTYLVPSFETVPPEMEKAAYHAIKSGLQGAHLVPVRADAMAQSGGAVHCIALGLSLPRPPGQLHYRAEGEGINLFYDFFAFMREFQQEFK